MKCRKIRRQLLFDKQPKLDYTQERLIWGGESIDTSVHLRLVSLFHTDDGDAGSHRSLLVCPGLTEHQHSLEEQFALGIYIAL